MAKWALVTGASSGIGAACARAFAQAGYNLCLTARRADRLEKLADELKGSAQVQFLPADISASADVARLVREWSNVPLTVMINNAGLAKGVDKIFAADVNDWEAMIDTNIKGLLYVTRGFLPGMIERSGGHIVNIGSVAGRWTYPGGSVYCATKFAVRALTEGIRMDLLGHPIRITNIEPGMVETEFSEVRLGSPERAKAVYKGMTPLTADDVAEAVLWSVSRPGHVNVQEMVLFPTDQVGIQLVHRD